MLCQEVGQGAESAGADAAGLTGIWLDRAGAGIRVAGKGAPGVRRITSPAQLGPLLGTLDSSR